MPTRKPPFNPIVFESRTRFLQRVQEAVSDGYPHYTEGNVPPTKMPGLCRKFAELYGVDLDKNARYRRQAAGRGNARLVMHFDGTRVQFVLLVSKGDHPAHQLEKLRSAVAAPIALFEYELVRQTVAGRQKPSWTWRFTKDAREGWGQRLRLATTHANYNELVQAWYSLYRVPGFNGVRSDVGRLVAQWRATWRLTHGTKACPVSYRPRDLERLIRKGIRKGEDGVGWCDSGFPSNAQLPTLFYVRKQADVGVRLSVLLRTLAAQSRAETQERAAQVRD